MATLEGRWPRVRPRVGAASTDPGFTRNRIKNAQVGCSRLAVGLASLGRLQDDG